MVKGFLIMVPFILADTIKDLVKMIRQKEGVSRSHIVLTQALLKGEDLRGNLLLVGGGEIISCSQHFFL